MKHTLPSFAVDSFVEESPKDFVPARYDGDGVQVSSAIGPDGKEYGDPVPMSPTIPPHMSGVDMGMREVVERIIREERILQLLQEHDVESEEEANDFYIDDDPEDPLTPYEKVFAPPPVVAAVQPKASTPGALPDRGSDSQSAGQVSDSKGSDTPAGKVPIGQPGSSQ